MTQEEKTLFQNYMNYFDGVYTGIQIMSLTKPDHMIKAEVQMFYEFTFEEMLNMGEYEIHNRWVLIHFALIQEETEKEGNKLKLQACEEFLESSVLHLIGL
jgi:hypothetical protein